MLLAQGQYVQAVAQAHQEACELNGRKYAKDERLKELLKAPNLRRVPRRAKSGGGIGGEGGSVPMPLDPTVQVVFTCAFSQFTVQRLPFIMPRSGVIFFSPDFAMSLVI